MKIAWTVALSVAMISTLGWGQAPSSVTSVFNQQFEKELQRIANEAHSVVGVQTIDLQDGTKIGVRPELVLPQASAIKIPILLQLFRKADQMPDLLRQKRSVDASNRTGGSGVLGQFVDRASELSVEDIAILMVVLSDNTATNILIEELGIDNVNQTIASMGFKETKLQRRMMDTDASARNEENISTPAEAAAIMERLSRCELPLKPVSCKRMRTILEMPKSDPFRDPIPDNVKVAFKPGYTASVRTAWALVDLPGRPYAIAIMTTLDVDGTNGDGADLVRQISKAAYDHFSRLAFANRYGARNPKPF